MPAYPIRVRVGAWIATPRGSGRVAKIQGAPGAQVVTVLVGLMEHEVTFRADDLAKLNKDFYDTNPAAMVEAVERFLETPETVEQPPEGGRGGAFVIPCTCGCGACHRLSTARDIHHPITQECLCERRDCECMTTTS